MAAEGLTPPEQIEWDGALHRFKPDGKGGAHGWYVLHSDGIPAGCFGNWKTALKRNWRADIGRRLTQRELDEHRRRMREAQAHRDALEAVRHKAGADCAKRIWEGAEPAPSDHPYLCAKGVQPHGLRVYSSKKQGLCYAGTEGGFMDCDGALVLPMFKAGGSISTVEFIGADGAKGWLGGAAKLGTWCMLGELADGEPLVLVEGWATGASIREATGWPVAIAGDAGNLVPVAKALRKQQPAAHLLIGADNDRPNGQYPQGTGQHYANEAAIAVAALVLLPPDVPSRLEAGKGSDWNDIHVHQGLEAVKAAFVAAKPAGGNSAEAVKGCLAAWVQALAKMDKSEEVLELRKALAEVRRLDPSITKEDIARAVSARRRELREKARQDRQEENQRSWEDLQRQHREKQRERVGQDLARPDDLNTEDMLERFVQVVTGNLVLDTATGARMVFRDFLAKHRHCVYYVQQGQTLKEVQHAYKWAESPLRMQVQALGFDPSHGPIFKDDNGVHLWNLWSPPAWERTDPKLAQPFLEFMEYLFPQKSDRGFVYDWLAHLFQKPGERPHVHIAHIAEETGTGRGLLSKILAALLGKHCADEMDLACLLDPRDAFRMSGISGKVLACCPEVKVPADERYQLKERMRTFFTQKVFTINEKGEKRWVEKACLRVFMASNHEDAVPISESERRIYAVRGPTQPRFYPDKRKSEAFYSRMYQLADDRQFLAAVWTWFIERNITETRADGVPPFNLGTRPPLNEMKRAMIDAGRTEEQRHALELARACPYDIICSTDLMELAAPPDWRQVDRGFGLHEWERRETTGQRNSRTRPIVSALREKAISTHHKSIKFKGQQRHVWILRNKEAWADASPDKLRQEALKVRRDLEVAGFTENEPCPQVLGDVLEMWANNAAAEKPPGGPLDDDSSQLQARLSNESREPGANPDWNPAAAASAPPDQETALAGEGDAWSGQAVNSREQTPSAGPDNTAGPTGNGKASPDRLAGNGAHCAREAPEPCEAAPAPEDGYGAELRRQIEAARARAASRSAGHGKRH